MAIKCNSCGIETERSETFIKSRRPFRRQEVHYCPGCWSGEQVKVHRFTLWLNLGYGILGVLCALLWPEQKFGWFLSNIFLFQLFCIATTLPHELGHAFIARWVGFRIFKVLVGMGQAVWKGKIFDFDTEIGPVPCGGFTFVAPREVKGYRRKFFAIIVAGPMINLLCLLFTLSFVDTNSLWKISTLEKGFAPITVFFYANLWMFIMSILPYTFTHPLGRFSTDGKLILSLPFMKPEVAAEAHASYFAGEAAENHNKGNLKEAHQWLERGLELYPKNSHLLVGRGLQLREEGNFRAARESFRQLLDQPSAAALLQAVMMNNIADADVMLDDPALLEEADHFSKEAIAMLGTMPQVKGTRGAVLVQLGRFEEAIPLLRQAMQGNESPANRAENACWLAIAEAKRGNTAETEKYLQQARQLHSATPYLSRAERMIAGHQMKA